MTSSPVEAQHNSCRCSVDVTRATRAGTATFHTRCEPPSTGLCFTLPLPHSGVPNECYFSARRMGRSLLRQRLPWRNRQLSGWMRRAWEVAVFFRAFGAARIVPWHCLESTPHAHRRAVTGAPARALEVCDWAELVATAGGLAASPEAHRVSWKSPACRGARNGGPEDESDGAPNRRRRRTSLSWASFATGCQVCKHNGRPRSGSGVPTRARPFDLW